MQPLQIGWQSGSIEGIVVVTDPAVGERGENLADQFVTATIRHFLAGDPDAAIQRIVGVD